MLPCPCSINKKIILFEKPQWKIINFEQEKREKLPTICSNESSQDTLENWAEHSQSLIFQILHFLTNFVRETYTQTGNNLPTKIKDAKSLNIFKSLLDAHL